MCLRRLVVAETGRLVAKVVFRPLQILIWIGAFLMFCWRVLARLVLANFLDVGVRPDEK